MKFDRLRIAGFKTFVDPSEMVIEPGLTGVVGPNGCGKSNLVEALRWAMGETSHKSMRASGMDDVIFSGSGQRPARNHAEVMICVDNSNRTAPAAFNEAETLEISRRIEREQGSTYRINGREVRARDVQLLFADAASGARSPSMVRQGQISEIIAAKPQARRRILEDAAGVAGLHARRHDAELKLKAAEDNLTRVVDVLVHIDSQLENLKRQVRQAERYRALAADLRQAEGVAHQIAWHHARSQIAAAESQMALATRDVASAMAAQGQAERERAVAQHAIEPLRQDEARAAEALQRLKIAREAIQGEERRAEARLQEIERRLGEIRRDEDRAAQIGLDAETNLKRLLAEQSELAQFASPDQTEAELATQFAALELEIASGDEALNTLQIALAEANATRAAAERAVQEAAARLKKVQQQTEEIRSQQTKRAELQERLPDPTGLHTAAESAFAALQTAEKQAVELDRQLAQARDAELKLRPGLQEADRKVQQLETEARTIAKLVDSGLAGKWPRAVDAVSVQKGYEIAFGAALGDDIEASTSPSAPIFWGGAQAEGDPALPAGADPLARFVTAPAQLLRRLNQIGIVSRVDGHALAAQLRPGQRLVSLEGDLWRWDGFIASANAPTAAARRLAEKNRLGEIEAAARIARQQRDLLRASAEEAQATIKSLMDKEFNARESAKSQRRALEKARASITEAERQIADFKGRTRLIDEAVTRFENELTEAEKENAAAIAVLQNISDTNELLQRVAMARMKLSETRAQAAEIRARKDGLARERQAHERRVQAVAQEIEGWESRRSQALVQQGEIARRLEETQAERTTLDGVPAELQARRRSLSHDIEIADTASKLAADRRSEGETALNVFDRAARDALAALAQTREARARIEAQLESAREKQTALALEIAESRDVPPDSIEESLGHIDVATLPDAQKIAETVSGLRRERDRIGPVNLRAEEELAEVGSSRTNLTREHDELTEAIRRLRRGIDSLNAEGRNRLLAAFEVVDGHFRKLFTRLFGGGTAELQLIESEDPLEAGLEILAHPPGKKPQVLTLLSGGEQALTATALIFAVFLTNPSPVCVLDEVDAPLDDANVDRLCDLLNDMAQETDTRFIVITHNPISMARMDRLFGVTMAERGVSQLVSVDLAEAERLAEAI